MVSSAKAKLDETKAAAEAGDAQAQFDLGCLYEKMAKAAAGDSHALSDLGSLYDCNASAEQSYTEAFKWWAKAAEKGHASAQNNLGAMYLAGLSVARDYEKAATWYRKAADQGCATAQEQLGRMYFSGCAVSKDTNLAVQLWLRAPLELPKAKEGISAGGLEWMYYWGRDMSRDTNLAGWLLQAAQELPEERLALYKAGLGWMHYWGWGSDSSDPTLGVQFWRRAAPEIPWASFGLSAAGLEWIWDWRRAVSKDTNLAVQFWRTAAEQSAVDRAHAAKAGRWELIQQAGKDSARARLGLYVSSHMRRLNTRDGGYVIGCPVARQSDGILYVGEDGVPFRHLKAEDAAEDVQREFGFLRRKPAEYAATTGASSEESEKYRIISDTASTFGANDPYIPNGVWECVDKANALWAKYQPQRINAKIRIGNAVKHIESFNEADHAWLMAEVSPGKWLAVEPQVGVFDRKEHPWYYEGLCHDFPSPKEVREYQTLVYEYNDAVEEHNSAVNNHNRPALKVWKDKLDKITSQIKELVPEWQPPPAAG